MTVPLDTHALLWFWWDDPRLSGIARNTICEASNRKLVSTATCWEIAIKVSLGKLNLGVPYRGFIRRHMERNNFELLPITDDHLAGVAELPFHHRDPFDRLLVAQARVEGVSIITSDSTFDRYSVNRIWN
jgi:PIN domain nuclease of toxin-antitoxin system